MSKGGSRKSADGDRDGCKNVVRIPQYTGTCWFNSLIYGMLYSDGMRKVLQQHVATWSIPLDKKKHISEKAKLLNEIYSVFKEILTTKYESNEMTSEDYRFFEKVSPEYILKTLFDYKPNVFYHNSEVDMGSLPIRYMRNLARFLNVRNVAYYKIDNDNKKDVVFVNQDQDTSDDEDVDDVVDKKFVDVVIYDINVIRDIDMKPLQRIQHEGQWFILDNVIVQNHDKQKVGHVVSGVTCKSKRYVYNGWIQTTVDAAMGKSKPEFESETTRKLPSGAPCELMKYDWLENQGDFCLNLAKCGLDSFVPNGTMCFNFSRGYRVLMYVNELYYYPNFSRKQPWRSEKTIDYEGMLHFPNSLDKKTLECVRNRTNVAVVSGEEMFDSKDFDTNSMKPDIMQKKSPKVNELVKNVHNLINNERSSRNGQACKHLIYSEASSRYGVKYIVSALVASGMHCALQKKNGKLVLDIKPGVDNVVLLSGSTVYGESIQVAVKKQIVATFNERPNNIYGENVLILVIDGAFKEGLDVFDVRYLHVVDNLTSMADRKQVIGRAQRMCGQRGLEFEKGKGWELKVYTYDIQIPREKRHNYDMNDSLFRFYYDKIGQNRDSLELANVLEDVVMSGAADFELTKAIHRKDMTFQDEVGIDTPVAYCQKITTTEEDGKKKQIKGSKKDGSKGGAPSKNTFVKYQVEWANDPKVSTCKQRPTKTFPIYSYDLIIVYLLNENPSLINDVKRKTLCTLFKTDLTIENRLKDFIKLNSKLTDEEVLRVIRNAKELKKRRVLTPSVYYSILRRLQFKVVKKRPLSFDPDMSDYPAYRQYQKEIKREFQEYRWEAGIENQCVDNRKKDEGAGVMTLTNTQRFVRDYFTPSRDQKGMLLYHSVGTGKTATGIVTASATFEKEGYRIIWVTRSSLKSDVNKNIVGELSAHEKIREAMAKGEIKPGMSQQDIRMKYLSKSWRIPPMSYKQFSNALKKKNSIGAELFKDNQTDPLYKTLLIIDEAHKLFAEGGVSAHEKHDIDAIIAAIHKSYQVSGKNSVRPLLMTATPFTKDPIEFMRIMNLIIDKESERLPETFDTFFLKYLTEGGRFTPNGRDEFLNTLNGSVSYLNRASDIRQFAQPVYITKNVDMTTFAKVGEISSIQSINDANKRIGEYQQSLEVNKKSVDLIRAMVKDSRELLKKLQEKKNEIPKEDKVIKANVTNMINETKNKISNYMKVIKENTSISNNTFKESIQRVRGSKNIYNNSIKNPLSIEAGIQTCFKDMLKKTKIQKKSKKPSKESNSSSPS